MNNIKNQINEHAWSTDKDGKRWEDYDTIKCNLQVRTRKSGDYIMVQGGQCKQSLKSYFINEKIPCEMRDSIPLLAEGNHILWIIGYRTSEANYVRSDTKRILEVQYMEEFYE